MPSLVQVLHQADREDASEIVIEVGQPPMVRTAAGSVSVGDALSERELFDALSAVLAPEQQAELAVGSVVEFHLDVDGNRWTLLTEPGAEGIVVRGRVQGASEAVELGAPMELPPLEPFDPSGTKGAPTPRRNRRTRWDLGVQEVAAGSKETAKPTASVQAAPEPEGWLISNAEGRDAATPPAAEDEPDESVELEFKVRSSETKIPQAESGSNGASDAAPILPPLQATRASDLGPPPPNPPRTAPPSTELPLATLPASTEDDDRDDQRDLAQLASSIADGSLCVIQGEGHGASLARHLSGDAFTVIDDAQQAGRVALTQAPGSTFVVRLEDPSTFLDWILRRLEEGSKVIVETRARTMEGARRILLGVHGGDRREQWLDAHPLCWVARSSGSWTLETL